MTLKEWKDSEYKLPLWKFLRSIHYYTERVMIYVVIGDAWLEEEKNGNKRIHDFWLTEDAFEGIWNNDYSEVERLLEYYADVPVWNVCGEFTEKPYGDHCKWNGKRINGRHITSCITARVYFRDIRDAWYREKANIQRMKRAERNKKKKEQGSENVD